MKLILTSATLLFACCSASVVAGSHFYDLDLHDLMNVKVTAQKKAVVENAQNIPLSISIYSSDKIESIFAQNLTDIGLTAPNVSLSPLLPGIGNFSIRGMGTVGQSIPSSDPAVGIVVDGISYGTIYGILFDVFDLESIEVLRGPQGTLFGRNATGGVVVARTSRPTDKFQGKIKATLGSHSRQDIMSLISGPLNDQWSAKLAVLAKDHDDLWGKETPTGSFMSGGHGKQKSTVIRPAIRYNNGSLDVTAITEYGKIEGDGLGTRNYFLDGVERNPYGSNNSTQQEDGNIDLEWMSLTLESNLNLWDGVLTTVYGYREIEQEASFDIDGDPNAARFHFADGTGMDQDQHSLEIRWAGNINNRTSLTSGLYYFQQDYEYKERRLLAQTLDRRGASKIEHSTYGIFAQADITLSETLILTVGGRYTFEEKEGSIGVIGDPNATGDCAAQSGPPFESITQINDCAFIFYDTTDWENLTPKVALTWHASNKIMAFASYTKGFRSGGYNVRFTDLTFITNPNNPNSIPGPYNEEVVHAFEIGLKTDWLDNSLRVNVSAFYNDFDDLQRTALNDNGGQEILNAASANVHGIEIDTVILLTEKLAIEGNYGKLDAHYKEADFLEATGESASNFNFTMVPDHTCSLSLSYYTDMVGLGSLTSRISYVYVDSAAADDFNRAEMSRYELYDASITFTDNTETLKVALFGRNLKDEIYSNFLSDVSALGTKSLFLMPPRTYGVELTYKF